MRSTSNAATCLAAWPSSCAMYCSDRGTGNATSVDGAKPITQRGASGCVRLAAQSWRTEMTRTSCFMAGFL
ncbi:hypothetical protein BGV48_16435 [Burkholderia ubonensis]|nr:hypothetical protein BGV48_16435 [Burkholderia ubonensis]